jgi:hypothetical protein
MLLNKHFAFTDGRVKVLWGQHSADLVAVGIPTVLHVLHVRSESQDTEGTSQLWLILAKNGLAGLDEFVMFFGNAFWVRLILFSVAFGCLLNPCSPVYGTYPASKLRCGMLKYGSNDGYRHISLSQIAQ